MLHYRSELTTVVHTSLITIMRTTLNDSDDLSIDTIDQPVAIINPSAPIWSKIPRQPLRLTYPFVTISVDILKKFQNPIQGFLILLCSVFEILPGIVRPCLNYVHPPRG